MSIPETQAEVAAFLLGLADGAPVETPLSAVFLAGDQAWKLRKSVRLAFVDFSTLVAREQAAKRDFALNHPMAPALYHDVVPITRGEAGLRFGGEGAALDWVVRMARVPPGDFLDAVAANGGLGPHLVGLADVVVAMHAALPPCAVDHPGMMRHVLEGNLATALEAGIPADRLAPLMGALRAELDRITPWLAARVEAGFVRRAHGDLHLGNLCLYEGHPVPFDALEFDEAMATIDLGYDLAFLLMDLDRLAGRAAANLVLNRYVARTGDVGLLGGLGLFIALRALIRAHVARRMGGDWAAYLDCALDALAPHPKRLLAIGGLPGSGKSTLARRIAPGLGRAPGAVVLRADEARKRRFGVAPETRLPPEAYAETASRIVLAGLMADAATALHLGQSVILDTTFLDPQDRAAARSATGEADFRAVWLQAPLDVLEARVGGRQGDASDATIDVLRRAAEKPGPTDWPVLATDDPAALDRFVDELTQPIASC